MQGLMGGVLVLVALAAARVHNEEAPPGAEPARTTEVQPGSEATPAGRPAAEPDEPDDDSRLLLGPTGRPLRKGLGYFSDHSGDAHVPIGLALRLSGGALGADLGVVTTPATFGKGFPLPWVSVSYHFGRARR